MKINKEIMRRLAEAEKKLEPTEHPKYVVMDFDGHYFGECGYDLSQVQFDAWLKLQDLSTQVVVMKYTVNGGNKVGKIEQNSVANTQNNPASGSEGKGNKGGVCVD